MKANSLDDILNVLEHPTSLNIIELDSEVQKQALHCVEKMFSYLGD
jgi:quinolinate synthase